MQVAMFQPITGKTLLEFVLVLVGASVCFSQERVLAQCGQDEGQKDQSVSIATTRVENPSRNDNMYLVSGSCDLLCSILYVSTLDGSLTALDSHGERQWAHQLSYPLFSSTLSYAKVRVTTSMHVEELGVSVKKGQQPDCMQPVSIQMGLASLMQFL